ncbi:hypothetical protein GCM10010170_105450 [Dactylosporangium salmoneum]|uniref:Uncharacterized protein n=1 Tax=Dactylosporangium salmoneum TaxID=53361 RepID=A0ABP5V1S9_9ACTN
MPSPVSGSCRACSRRPARAAASWPRWLWWARDSSPVIIATTSSSPGATLIRSAGIWRPTSCGDCQYSRKSAAQATAQTSSAPVSWWRYAATMIGMMSSGQNTRSGERAALKTMPTIARVSTATRTALSRR